MLILSQDRRAIVNLDKLKTIELDKFSNYKSIKIFRETDEVEAGVCELCIGEYETKKRAKEVLQEIIERYDVLKKNITYAQGDGGFTFNEHYYYEMPEK